MNPSLLSTEASHLTQAVQPSTPQVTLTSRSPDDHPLYTADQPQHQTIQHQTGSALRDVGTTPSNQNQESMIPYPIEAVQLRGIPNHIATIVSPCEPWNYVNRNIPDDARKDKASWGAWAKDPATKHLYYTGAEGLNPDLRANATHNPIRRIHALIADFDSKISEKMTGDLTGRCPVDFRPAWLSKTFSSGARLLYLFEEPLVIDNEVLLDKFLVVAKKELRLEKLLPGLDSAAWSNPYTTYEVGTEWTAVEGSNPIPTNVLHYWLTQAAQKTDFKDFTDLHIPIEDVAKEVERLYPGRWQGPFEIGSRGVVFFDPRATNPTAAIVTEAGMVCFSQDKLFYSWQEILGRTFVEKYQSDKIGAAVKDVWYDGRSFYWKQGNVWMPHSKEDFVVRLKVRHGMDTAKSRGATASEVDRALDYVGEHRRVVGVAPKVYDRQDVVWVNGQKFLNCAAVRTMEPDELPQKWGANFPWLAHFLSTAFAPEEQMWYLLAWWKRFYQSAYQGDLLKGHALFLAGDVGRGKTLLARIIGDSMGGSADASDYLNSDTNFNKELLEVGVWNIDDGVAANSAEGQLKFTEMIKRAVANPTFNYHAKYKDSQKVIWNGRIIVTLNSDASSLRIIPALDTSIEEKLVVLKFSEAERKFPDWREMEAIIKRELPCFLRWMVDWEIPAEYIGDKRFGTKAYINEELRLMSLGVSGVSDLMELVELWIKRCNPESTYGEYWEGTASAWLTAVNTDEALRPLVSKYNTRLVGRKFTEAAGIRDSGIQVANESRYKGTGNKYRIRLKAGEAITHGGPSTKVNFDEERESTAA